MTSSQTSSPLTDPWQALAGLCDPHVLCAPKTWGDPLRSFQLEKPQQLEGMVRYVQNNVAGYPWCNAFVLAMAVEYSHKVQYKTIHWAVPKGHHVSVVYYLDDEHLRLLALLKLMLFERYGIDPKQGDDLPVVTLRGSNAHLFPPDRYFFQYDHTCLHEQDIRASMRFLMHGLIFQTLDDRRVIIRPHLLRHGFATWALNVAKEPVDIVAKILNQKNLDVTKYYGRPNPRLIAERSYGLMTQISSYLDIEEIIQRSPEELREQLKNAQRTHGTLARVRGGRCLLERCSLSLSYACRTFLVSSLDFSVCFANTEKSNEKKSELPLNEENPAMCSPTCTCVRSHKSLNPGGKQHWDVE